MKAIRKILSIGLTATALTGCGGGGSDRAGASVGDIGGTGNTGGNGTSTTGASCAGTSVATAYDVFLNTALGIAPSSVSRAAQRYGASTDAGQCISIAGSAAQGDASPGTLQAATTDGWNAAITYVDPVGAAVAGGERFDQGLLVTCTGGGDTFRHVAVRNPAGASTYVGTEPATTVVKGTAFVNYVCAVSGSTTAAVLDATRTATFSATSGSVTVTDGANGSTTIPAAGVASLFGTGGYALNGNVLRWSLYQLPVGTTTRQVIVATNQRANGTYNIGLFVSQ